MLSMTGHGEARGESGSLRVSAEVRSVNNRHFKLSLRAPEPFNLMEVEFERVVRRFVRRGTIMIQLRVERPFAAQDYRINPVALRSYVEQVRAACAGFSPPVDADRLAAQILALPGVAPEPGAGAASADDDWPEIEPVLVAALERLQTFRQREGARMADELVEYHADIVERLERIRQRGPQVVAGLRERLLERVRNALADSGVSVEPSDLIREVAIAAERSDIAEELVRLASHLEQFEQVVRKDEEAPGRKLEFVVQEMGRETNTIGSKAGDVEVSRQVVEIKATLEKVRELIQNIE